MHFPKFSPPAPINSGRRRGAAKIGHAEIDHYLGSLSVQQAKSALTVRMSVSDLVTEILAVTLLSISGLDEINYDVPPFLYAVNNIC